MQDNWCNGTLKYNIFNSSQTRCVYQYMNCKRKLLHCNANIKFNKTCLKKNLIPRYAHINIPEYNEAAIKTKAKAQISRIKNEIQFLYKKKEQLNTQLYCKHLHNANTWQKNWDTIEDAINQKLKPK